MAIILLALKLLSYLIIGDAVLSWVIAPDRFPRSITSRICEPLYRPVRKVLDPAKTGGLDLAPLVLVVFINILIQLIARY
jgi:uncharacterized protein YggT (Ycf19 family)